MTVGQRIAQKRRELGLSQEALGERLGVSRQAVYKWESDTALPEIEKLVNLSRELGLSIDWLLGQEDESREPQELTAEQLRMVEEIVGRYLAAQPAQTTVILRETDEETEPDPEGESETGSAGVRWLKRWGLAWAGLAALVVMIMVIFNLFDRLDSVRQENQNLQMAVADVRADVNSQIYSITSRVEDILQSQNSLTAEQSAVVSSTDYRTNTVTVSARALPRTYAEGMTAEFLLTSGGETVTVPGELGEDHAFTAQLTGPLSDSVSVSVVFLAGDQRETQLLNQFLGMYSESFPDLSAEGNLWGWRDEIPEYASVRIGPAAADKVKNLRLGLFQDQKLLAWYQHLDEQPSYYVGERTDTEFFRLDGEWAIQSGHVYCVAAVVTDEYGRERIYQDFPVMYDPESGHLDIYAPNDNTIVFDPDPANWDY